MQVTPLPGYMIVKVESMYKNTGLIKVPDRYQKRPNIIGTIKKMSFRKIDERILGHALKVGDRVIVSHLGGHHLAGDEFIYPVTTARRDERRHKYDDSVVLAIVPLNMNLKPHSQNVERCQFCGEAKSGARQNMIMMDGVCPRCGKESNGEVRDTTVRVTDDEVAAMIGVA